MSIQQTPIELLQSITEYLNYSDYAQLLSTCHGANDLKAGLIPQHALHLEKDICQLAAVLFPSNGASRKPLLQDCLHTCSPLRRVTNLHSDQIQEIHVKLSVRLLRAFLQLNKVQAQAIKTQDFPALNTSISRAQNVVLNFHRASHYPFAQGGYILHLVKENLLDEAQALVPHLTPNGSANYLGVEALALAYKRQGNMPAAFATALALPTNLNTVPQYSRQQIRIRLIEECNTLDEAEQAITAIQALERTRVHRNHIIYLYNIALDVLERLNCPIDRFTAIQLHARTLDQEVLEVIA